ncbi:EAL and HDOD domain-containing protein [Clostridium kluyveri]|uniref:EAL and HDOD domain-containing protein n=1 Tax=Clostridium kluyveri TaxID=1534 RepID=UPI0022474106|nr:EAL domain-containing protein [Clostridium kluyveri]UZQ49163.1 EAL domain-containing protein [Clostridium kluyveri]
MNIFIARQPILDKYNKIYGYELLFRNDIKKNKYSENDGDKATMEIIINSFFYMDINKMTQNKMAFINFTENILTSQIFQIISPKTIVIEILENIRPSNKIINACKILKQYGFTLALDDFSFSYEYEQLIKLVDIIKVDFNITKGYERKNIVKLINTIKPKNIKFLAEKIETLYDFNEAIKYGYTYFQGYYFSKPTIISGKKIPENELIYVKILNEVNSEEISITKIENLIKNDVSLSYNLLKIINSAEFCLKTRIESVKQALIYFGEDRIKKWINLTCLKLISHDKPEIFMINTLVRAHFAELIFIKLGLARDSFNAFLTGMLSLIDIILERPLKEILEELNISDEVKSALLGEKNNYYKILKLIIAYENEQWDKVKLLNLDFGLDDTDLINTYFESIYQVNLYL